MQYTQFEDDTSNICRMNVTVSQVSKSGPALFTTYIQDYS